MAYSTTKNNRRVIDEEDEGTCACFGRSKTKQNSNYTTPLPLKILLTTRISVSTQPRRQVPPGLVRRTSYFNAAVPFSKSENRENTVEAAQSLPLSESEGNVPYHNPCIRPSRTASSIPAGASHQRAACSEPSIPHPSGHCTSSMQQQKKQHGQSSSVTERKKPVQGPPLVAPLAATVPYYNPSIRPSSTASSSEQKQQSSAVPVSLPSTFSTFPERKAAIKGKTRPKPPPLAMDKIVKFQSPYTLTREEEQAGLSPQSLIGRGHGWRRASNTLAVPPV